MDFKKWYLEKLKTDRAMQFPALGVLLTFTGFVLTFFVKWSFYFTIAGLVCVAIGMVLNRRKLKALQRETDEHMQAIADELTMHSQYYDNERDKNHE